MKVGFLGLGLIGASFARALRDKPGIDALVGYGHRETTVRAALDLGVIDEAVAAPQELLGVCDVIVIGTPTLLAERQLIELIQASEGMEKPPILTDVASVKGNLWRAVQDLSLPAWPSQVVLGHPIAGSEQSGVHAGRADLFEHHRVILTPHPENDRDAVEVVKQLWEQAGAEVVLMPVELHDKVLAATSHLPHMLAYSLVDTLAHSRVSEDIFRYAAGGFKDFTRIASSDPIMWRDIAIANQAEVLSAIDEFSAGLDRLRDAIAKGDADAMTDIFNSAKAARDRFVLTGKPPERD
jgi:prephenate dehydrogenase